MGRNSGRHNYHSYYYKKENEVGEEEVSYTFHLTLFRKLLRMRAETKTYVRNPDDIWYHKYVGMFPNSKEDKEIAEVLEIIRQREKYKFYMEHVFI